MTDAGLTHLGGLARLRALKLGPSLRVTDAGIGPLAALPGWSSSTSAGATGSGTRPSAL